MVIWLQHAMRMQKVNFSFRHSRSYEAPVAVSLEVARAAMLSHHAMCDAIGMAGQAPFAVAKVETDT